VSFSRSEPLSVLQLDCITFPLAAAVESSNMVGFSLKLAMAKQLSYCELFLNVKCLIHARATKASLSVLTQNVHSAPNTQQAEKLASHAQREGDVPVNFS
jgi:hypothetical protein